MDSPNGLSILCEATRAFRLAEIDRLAECDELTKSGAKQRTAVDIRSDSDKRDAEIAHAGAKTDTQEGCRTDRVISPAITIQRGELREL